MRVELSAPDQDGYVILGFEGEYTIGDVRSFLGQLEDDVGVGEVTLSLEASADVSATLPRAAPTDAEEEGTPAAIETSARVQADSLPYKILRVLEESDEAIRTEEIYVKLAQERPELEQNAVASRLWNLYRRGLVNKRPFPEDNRQKVYTLTGRGVYALEQAVEREA